MITAVNPPTNLAKGASGQYDSVTVRYASTLSLSGKQLFFNPALWVSVYEIETSLPTAGFRVNYPFSPQTLNFQLIPAANSQTQLNLRAELTVINNKTFEVTLYFVHFADINNFISNTNIPGLPRVLNRQISGNSVYNEQKLMVFRVSYQNGSNLHQAYTEINYQAGHYNRSINNGPPIAPGIIILTRGGNPVANFSQVANTKVNFAINTTDIVFHEYFAGIVQINATGSGNYWNATNMMYARLSNVKNTVESISNTAILSPQQISQVGGGYSGSFIMDRTYFSGSGSYRVFVAVRIGDRWQSYITNELGVSENYETTFGATTAEWNLNMNLFPDCLQGVQSGQVVEICFEVDKNDYNTNLGLNGVGGSFDNNFISVNLLLLDGIPVSGQVPTGTPYPVIISQDANFHSTCTSFPVPGSWEGENKFFAAVYTFNVPTPQGTIVDQVVKYAQLGVADPDGSTAGNLTLVSVFDEEGNPIPILCENFEGNIIVTVQNDTGVLDVNLVLTWTVHELGNILNTFNGSIVSADSVFSGGLASITIDPSALPLGTEICITLIVEGASEPVVCENANFVGTLYSTGVLPEILTYALAYDFSGFPGYENSTITHTNLDLVYEVIETNVNNGIISFSQVNQTGEPFHILSASINIVVQTSICIYEFCFDVLLSVAADGFSIDVSQEVLPGSNACIPPQLPGGCQDQDLGITTVCNEGVVTATLTGTPVGVITDVLEYNFDGLAVWTLYTVPVEVEPEDEICSTYFRRTLTITDCDPVVIYAVQDFCCPATECPEFECEPLETYDPDLNELELSIECGSEVTDSILIEYSIDGGVTYLEYTVPIDMTGVDSVLWRMIVQFDTSYPECDPNIFEYEGEFSLEGENPNLCISTPTLEATFLNGCHSATTGGDVYFVASDIVYYSTNLGLTWTVYTSGEICGANVVIWKRIVMYSNDCPKSCIVKASADPCCGVTACEYECYFSFLYDSAEGCALSGAEIAGCGTNETALEVKVIWNGPVPTAEEWDLAAPYDLNFGLTCDDTAVLYLRAEIAKEGCANKFIYATFNCETCTEDGDVTPPTEDLNITYWGPLAD